MMKSLCLCMGLCEMASDEISQNQRKHDHQLGPSYHALDFCADCSCPAGALSKIKALYSDSQLAGLQLPLGEEWNKLARVILCSLNGKLRFPSMTASTWDTKITFQCLIKLLHPYWEKMVVQKDWDLPTANKRVVRGYRPRILTPRAPQANSRQPQFVGRDTCSGLTFIQGFRPQPKER